MQRRSLLRTTALTLGAGLAGCSRLGQRPEVRMDSGRATLHPATELYIANGLQPDGDDRVFSTITPDESPELVGPDAENSIADRLRNPGIDDQFHVVVQLRSTPAAPMSIWPVAGGAFGWRDRSTLHVDVEVEPWGSPDRIDDEELRSAEELVYTGVWDLTPAPDTLPEDLVLELATRG